MNKYEDGIISEMSRQFGEEYDLDRIKNEPLFGDIVIAISCTVREMTKARLDGHSHEAEVLKVAKEAMMDLVNGGYYTVETAGARLDDRKDFVLNQCPGKDNEQIYATFEEGFKRAKNIISRTKLDESES